MAGERITRTGWKGILKGSPLACAWARHFASGFLARGIEGSGFDALLSKQERAMSSEQKMVLPYPFVPLPDRPTPLRVTDITDFYCKIGMDIEELRVPAIVLQGVWGMFHGGYWGILNGTTEVARETGASVNVLVEADVHSEIWKNKKALLPAVTRSGWFYQLENKVNRVAVYPSPDTNNPQNDSWKYGYELLSELMGPAGRQHVYFALPKPGFNTSRKTIGEILVRKRQIEEAGFRTLLIPGALKDVSTTKLTAWFGLKSMRY